MNLTKEVKDPHTEKYKVRTNKIKKNEVKSGLGENSYKLCI